MALGAGGSSPTLNNGRFFITLKPQDRARRLGRRGHRPAAAAAREGRGRAAVPAGGAGRQRRRPGVAHAVPVHPAGRRPRRAERLGAEGARQAEDAARAARRRHRPADGRHDADPHHRPRQAARFGITPQLIDDTLYDAFGQRQVAQYFTQLNSYHVVMEVLPELQGDAGQPGQDLRQARRPRASRCRWRPSPNGRRARSSRCRSATRASSRR